MTRPGEQEAMQAAQDAMMNVHDTYSAYSHEARQAVAAAYPLIWRAAIDAALGELDKLRDPTDWWKVLEAVRALRDPETTP